MRLPPEEFKRLYDEVTVMIKTNYGIDPRRVRSRNKTMEIRDIRRSIARILKTKYDLSTPNIGLLLNVDHSTIVGYLK